MGLADDDTDPLEPAVVSSCCKADVEPAHPDGSSTNFFVCSECKKPCGFELPKDETVH